MTQNLKTISELRNEFLLFDHGVAQALQSYWRHGLLPGSFGEACLLGDYELALYKAHYLLRSREDTDQIVLNMVSIAQCYPSYIRGSTENIKRWSDMGGAGNATKDILMLCKLEWPDCLLGSFNIPERL